MTCEKHRFNGFTDYLLREQSIINLITRSYEFAKMCKIHMDIIVYVLCSLVWSSFICNQGKLPFNSKSCDSTSFSAYMSKSLHRHAKFYHKILVSPGEKRTIL